MVTGVEWHPARLSWRVATTLRSMISGGSSPHEMTSATGTRGTLGSSGGPATALDIAGPAGSSRAASDVSVCIR